jgi:hypothetical protein
MAFEAGNETISEFNEAGLQIMRLNNMWVTCERLRMGGKLEDWRWQLEGAEIELHRDIDKLKKVSELNKINEDIKNSIMDKNKFYLALKEKMIFLKRCQDEAGKGAKYMPRDERM